MLGALHLSAPHQSRNRDLFERLITNCGPNLAPHLDESMLLVSTSALDDRGHRAKVSSLCAPIASLDLRLVNGYPNDVGLLDYPPQDPYSQPLVDHPVFAGPTPMDLMTIGDFEVVHLPSRSSCVFSSVEGSAISQDGQPVTLGSLLVSMPPELAVGSNLVSKVANYVLGPVHGSFVGQLATVGPEPLLMLLRSSRQLFLYLIYQRGSFYLVWSDFSLPNLGHACTIWPLVTFDRGPERMSLAFSIRLLRNRWVRWLTPRHGGERWVSMHRLSGKPEQVEAMRIPLAIAALSEWLGRHSNDPRYHEGRSPQQSLKAVP